MSAQNPNHKQRRLELAQERGLVLRIALLVLLIASAPQAKAEPPDDRLYISSITIVSSPGCPRSSSIERSAPGVWNTQFT
jgi:hypothetical protein